MTIGNVNEKVKSHALMILTLLLTLVPVLAGSAFGQTDTVRIMPLGNSITRGVAGSTDDTGYRRQLYLALQASGFRVDFVGSQVDGIPTDFDRDHEGHGGWHANQIRDNIHTWLTANHADFIMLHIGTNDISGSDEDVAEVAAILDSINVYEALTSDTVVVLVARIILRADGLNPATIAFNDAVDSMVNARIALGDQLVLVDMENALVYPDHLTDNVHPNDSGYARMAVTWYNALEPILPEAEAVLDSLSLTATSPSVFPDDDLVVNYVLGGTSYTAAVAWSLNASPIMSLYFPFEGGADNAVLDVSGNGRSATPVGDPTYRPDFGHDGLGTFAFDGDDALSCGEVFPVGQSYTKAAWVYRTGTANNNILSGDMGANGHAFWAPTANGNRLAAGHNSAWTGVQDTMTLPAMEWHHAAVTYDDASAMMVLYRDGQIVDTATLPPAEQDVTDATALIGAFGTGHYWGGYIDDVRLYNRALSPEQVALIANDLLDTLNAAETQIGDTWRALVTPYASTVKGITYTSNPLTVNSDEVIEIANLNLATDPPGDLVIDDLICSFDLVGDAVAAATAWELDGQPLMRMYYPAEGGLDNAFLDFSGSANHGTVGAGVSWDTTAGINGTGGLILDGTISADIFVGPIMPTGAYTKTAWIRPSGSQSGMNVISGTSAHALWTPNLVLASGHNPGSTRHVEDPDTLDVDSLYFIAVTFDPAVASGHMVLYKNGVQVDMANGVPTQLGTDPSVYIGAYNSQYNFLGMIDDARLYDRALSPEQIESLYNDGPNVIRYTETFVGDEWQALVTPFSQRARGITYASNVVEIVSDVTLENVSIQTVPPNNVTTDDFTCTYTLTGGSLTAATAWYVNGFPMMRLYLPFEGNSTLANSLHDFSGNGNTVTAVGDPLWYAAGGHDGFGAFELDGNDYLVAGEVFPTSSSYTKAAWVFRQGSGLNGGNNIMSGDVGPGGHAFWAPDSYGNRLSAGQNGKWNLVQDSVALAIGEWFHVAVTYDAVSHELTLYKNGTAVDDTVVTLAADQNVTDATLHIGAFNTSHIWLGLIDDVRLYPRALSNEQIFALYDVGRDLIKYTETQTGDTWQAVVTPLSEKEAGLNYPSNIITIQPNAIVPTTLVISPTSGFMTNALPELTLQFTDDLGLDRAYYRLDSCLGPWSEIWSYNSLASDTTVQWTVPAVGEGTHQVYFRAIDDAGNSNEDTCTFSWSFTLDTTRPAPATNLQALTSHQKVTLSWTSSASPDAVGAVVMRQPWEVGAYPEYDDLFGTPLGYPSSPSEGTMIYQGTAESFEDTGDTLAMPRNVYYYTVFTIDEAGNHSIPSAGQQARAFNYWLGDVSGDGLINFTDLQTFSNAFATLSTSPNFHPEFDIGPTSDSSTLGIPVTDDAIDFEDLILFAINFGQVSPAKQLLHLNAVASDEPSGLRLEYPGDLPAPGQELVISVYLENHENRLKCLRFDLPVKGDQLVFERISRGTMLEETRPLVFIHAAESHDVVTVNLAVLGSESTFHHTGELVQLHFRTTQEGPMDNLKFTRIDGRNITNGSISMSQVFESTPEQLPTSYALAQNYPNPYNAVTQIEYQLPRPGAVTLKIYNIQGQVVRTLVNDFQEAGSYRITWDSRNDRGETVASGVYLYRLVADEYTAARKMMLLK